MSVKTWKEEFYSVPAVELIDCSDIVCLEHAIKKWEGALEDNLKKHKVKFKDFVVVDEEGYSINFNDVTCALCQKYPSPNCHDYNENYCPFIKLTGSICNTTKHSDEIEHKLLQPMKAMRNYYVQNNP